MAGPAKVLVIGGSRGIGRAIVHKLVEHDYAVDYTYHRSPPPAQALPRSARAYACDAGSAEAIERLYRDTGAADTAYHALVYNAGQSGDGLAAAVDLAAAQRLMEVNFWGFVHVFNRFYGALDRSGGRVVAVGSVGSQRHAPGNAVYSASKAALAAFVRGIACENGRRGLTANCVEPGYIDTDLIAQYRARFKELEARIPARRLGRAEDVAELVAFLLSPQSAYVNGACLRIDGGLMAGF
jgi:NAD(P)-dependent dehydrogenase (short-subunit alcohol dehydrogenase family)